MYVSRLDRPWLETAFLMQGLKITSEDEIAMLQRICNHVWIDVILGSSPDPRYIALRRTGGRARSRARDGGSRRDLRKTDWSVQGEVQNELRQARRCTPRWRRRSTR